MAGYRVKLITLEVGSRGMATDDDIERYFPCFAKGHRIYYIQHTQDCNSGVF